MMTRLVRQIKDFDPDVIHLQAGHLWFNWALPLLGDHPLVLTVHDASKHVGDGKSGRRLGWVLDRACYQPTQRIVHAPKLKSCFFRGYGLQVSTVHVVPLILLGDDSGLAHVPEDERLILFFGRLWEYKGLEYLIQAEPSITARVPQAKIAHCRHGPRTSITTVE